jgi:hypothetical protein
LIPVAPPLTVKETRDVTVPPTVTVYVVEALPEMGRFTVRELGETLTVKLPDMTTREADVEWTSDPLVPVIGIEYVPAATPVPAVSVNVPDGETGLAVIPEGGETLHVTVPVKPFEGVAVSV